jgi:hypothetical protein
MVDELLRSKERTEMSGRKVSFWMDVRGVTGLGLALLRGAGFCSAGFVEKARNGKVTGKLLLPNLCKCS